MSVLGPEQRQNIHLTFFSTRSFIDSVSRVKLLRRNDINCDILVPAGI